MNWKENFKEGKELILSTCSKSLEPNANIVISLGFTDDKLMIADCQMNTTLKNLKENPKICVVGGYLRIKGSIEIFSSGKYFEKGAKIVVAQDDSFIIKNIILIKIDEVFDLGEVKKII